MLPGSPCSSPTGSPAKCSALWPSVQGRPTEPSLGTLPWECPTGLSCKCNSKVSTVALLISGHKSSDLILLQLKGLAHITLPTRSELSPGREMIWSRKREEIANVRSERLGSRVQCSDGHWTCSVAGNHHKTTQGYSFRTTDQGKSEDS